MNGLPLHPAIVHIPLGLAVILPLIALGIIIAVWRGWLTARTWMVVVALQVVIVGAGLLALRSGEAEEEAVEAVVAEQSIEAHEEAAHRFMIGAGISLALGTAGLIVLNRRRAMRWTTGAATVAAAVAAFLAVSTGAQGGKLVYGQGAATAYTAGQAGNAGVAEAGEPKATQRGDDD